MPKLGTRYAPCRSTPHSWGKDKFDFGLSFAIDDAFCDDLKDSFPEQQLMIFQLLHCSDLKVHLAARAKRSPR